MTPSVYSATTRDRKMSTKLYVGNVPDGAKDKDLRDLFMAFGEVDEVACLSGYGFVVGLARNK